MDGNEVFFVWWIFKLNLMIVFVRFKFCNKGGLCVVVRSWIIVEGDVFLLKRDFRLVKGYVWLLVYFSKFIFGRVCYVIWKNLWNISFYVWRIFKFILEDLCDIRFFR